MMIKKFFIIIITISLAFSAMITTVGAVTTEKYGYINVYLMELKKEVSISAMTVGDNVYVNASFYEMFGFNVELKNEVIIIGNVVNENIFKGAIGFYVDDIKCCRVNNAISEVYQSPFKAVKNDKGAWIPFEYSLYMLNGSLLMSADGKILLSSPRQGIFDLLNSIAVNQSSYSFDYTKDFGYESGTENALNVLNHFVNVFNGLLTFDGASWTAFMNCNPIIDSLLGNKGYDLKYGGKIARMVCTNSSEELLEAVDNISTVNEFLSEDGALAEIVSDYKFSNDVKIGELYDESQKLLKDIDKVNGGVSEYNRIYNQLEDAMDKSSFLKIGNNISDFQKEIGNVSVGLKLFSIIAETAAYYKEFGDRDLFAVDSLEMFAKELPDLTGNVSFYTKSAMLLGVESFREDANAYAVSRFIEENIVEIISEGFDICAKANIALLAWDLISLIDPFISDGLSAADKYELSVYAMCVQNEAHRVYNEKLSQVLSSQGNISVDNLKELSKYAYAYLKLCYVTRNSAIRGIHTLSEEGKKAQEIIVDQQNLTNSKILPLLNLAKESVNEGSFACLGLYNSVISTDCVVNNDLGEFGMSDSSSIDESDAIEAFQNMINKVDFVWFSGTHIVAEKHEYSQDVKVKVDFSDLTVSEIIENIVVCKSVPTGVYEAFSDEGINYIAETVEANAYSDPKKKFWTSYELDADLVDWILENVFGKTPDRTASSEDMYYHGDNVYVDAELGGGPGYIYTISKYEKNSDGSYDIVVKSECEVSFDGSVTYFKFTGTPKQDDEHGIYWQIHSYEETEKPSTSSKPDKNPETSETELFNKYIKENLTLCQAFPSDDIEKEKGVFSALIKDFDNNGKKEMVTFSIAHNAADQAQIVLNLYTIKDNTVMLSDTSEEIFASGAGNFQGIACGFLENNEIKIQRENWNYGGSSHSNNYITFRVNGDKLVLVNDYSLYEFYRYDTYEYKENVSGKIFSTSEEYYSAVKKAGYDSDAHNHVGYEGSEFDVKTDDYKTAECFKGNHIFTLCGSQEMLVSGEYRFLHDNTNLDAIIN